MLVTGVRQVLVMEYKGDDRGGRALEDAGRIAGLYPTDEDSLQALPSVPSVGVGVQDGRRHQPS